MVTSSTISDMLGNINTGIEYEIALFYKLSKDNNEVQRTVMDAINRRADSQKIKSIISMTDMSQIENALMIRGLKLVDSSFETQNDLVGPADIVLYVRNNDGYDSRIGLSVKYSNTCTLNVTSRKFITDYQIHNLKKQLPYFTGKYIKEMTEMYGNVENWFRKRKPSRVTDEYIDLIRDAVIENWKYVQDKPTLLSTLFHIDSPIDFWVVTYGNNGYDLNTKPQTINVSRADEIIVRKYQTSFIAFYLDDIKVGHMQVKFNNGFVEKCKKQNADFICQGVRMSYGQPFSSWNFNVEK